MSEKVCTKCGASKAHSEFGRRARATDGLESWCKACRNAARRARRAAKQEAAPKCKECGVSPLKSTNKIGICQQNPVCRAAYFAAWNATPAYKEKQRAVDLLRYYRITPAQYDRILEAQHGKCWICEGFRQKPGETLHVDHDHDCCDRPDRTVCGKCIRGLLCGTCNRVLASDLQVGDGFLGQKYEDYLRFWAEVLAGNISNPWFEDAAVLTAA